MRAARHNGTRPRVPREHRRDIWTIPRDEAMATMSAAHALARAVRGEFGAIGVNLRHNSGSLAGQDVFHFHLHVVPRYEGDTVSRGASGARRREPPPGGDGERRRVADSIRRALALLDP
ncbi:MAG: HIT family protein [Gaiellaceae bacterium]